MKKAVLFIILITIASKILGLLRDIVLSYFYGASAISDAFLISIIIPSIIFGLIVNGIATGYIPLFSMLQIKYGSSEGLYFTNNLLNILLILSTIIFVLGFTYTEQLVRIFAIGFENETLILASKFTRISLVSIYFTGIISLLSGFLQLHDDFVTPAFIGIPFNFFIIVFIFISHFTNPLMLSIGIIVASGSQLILLIPNVFKKGYRYKFIFKLNDIHIKRLIYLTLPLALGMSVDQINVIVDKTLASQIVTGGISALDYANRINWFIQGIFVISITTVMFPSISKMALEKNMNGFKKALVGAVCAVNVLVIPGTVGAMIFAEPIVDLLFGRGAFDDKAVALTSDAFFYYSVGMLGIALREIFSRAFYSLQDTKTPMINSIITVILNIILSILLARFLGVGGIALASSISTLFCALLLMNNLRMKIGSFSMNYIITTFIKIVSASTIMGILAKVVYGSLNQIIANDISLIITIVTAIICYFLIIYYMKIKEIDILFVSICRVSKLLIKKSR